MLNTMASARFSIQNEPRSVLPPWLLYTAALHRSSHAGLRRDTQLSKPKNKYFIFPPLSFVFPSMYPTAESCNYINLCSLSSFCASLSWAFLRANKRDTLLADSKGTLGALRVNTMLRWHYELCGQKHLYVYLHQKLTDRRNIQQKCKYISAFVRKHIRKETAEFPWKRTSLFFLRLQLFIFHQVILFGEKSARPRQPIPARKASAWQVTNRGQFFSW